MDETTKQQPESRAPQTETERNDVTLDTGKLPEDFKQVHNFMSVSLLSQNAPAKVVTAWESFMREIVAWKLPAKGV